MADRVALVTGGNRRHPRHRGRHLRLTASGVTVVAGYHHDAAAAADFARRLGVQTVQADVGDADADACGELVRRIHDDHGRLDLLVNNAGLLVEHPSTETSPQEWDRAVAVNLSAAFHLYRAAIPGMRQHVFGRIVNISSVTAAMGSPSEAAYGAAKAGLHGLTRSLARETARDGITVNCVVAGVFETAMTKSMPERTQSAILRMIPVGRRGDPDELARAVAFLLDEDARYITGSLRTVDGGLSMGG